MIVVEIKLNIRNGCPPASVIKPFDYLKRGSQYFFWNDIHHHRMYLSVISGLYQSYTDRGVTDRKSDALSAWWADP